MLHDADNGVQRSTQNLAPANWPGTCSFPFVKNKTREQEMLTSFLLSSSNSPWHSESRRIPHFSQLLTIFLTRRRTCHRRRALSPGEIAVPASMRAEQCMHGLGLVQSKTVVCHPGGFRRNPVHRLPHLHSLAGREYLEAALAQ